MINLPVLRRLDVTGYGLYPGINENPGLHVEFKPGLTLVLGANGLGKTTLITILYRMLTGPSDIPNIEWSGELGNRRLDARPLGRSERRILAARVVDGAIDATARLTFTLGDTEIEVTRALALLNITTLKVDGLQLTASDEEYQRIVLAQARLFSFGDWILALRHLTFYFEDRRALVWDMSAQKQLLRLLFLPPAEAGEWTRMERAILETDSLVRNLQYAFGKEERTIARTERALSSADEVRQQLRLLQKVQGDDEDRLAPLNDELMSALAARQLARVNSLTAEQAHESAVRSVERLQLNAVSTAFPSASQTAKYIIGHILAENQCLTCSSHVPEFSQEIQNRLKDHECPICGSPVEPDPHQAADVRTTLAKALKHAQGTEVQSRSSAAERAAAEEAYDELLTGISALTESIARRSAEINDLLKRLPPDEQELHKRRADLASINARLEQLRNELQLQRAGFKQFVTNVNQEIARQKDAIKAEFERYATGFLLEECELVWSPRKSRVGEAGELVEFAAFELTLTGTNFASPVRRTGPQHVSESQREFIDLSFRMALIRAASVEGGTLIIDAPESSLDAVFVTRAADVLTRFSESQSGNRLVVTSNLVDGNLIPELLRRSKILTTQDSRVVDLLVMATPTAATRQLSTEYAKVREDLFRKAQEDR